MAGRMRQERLQKETCSRKTADGSVPQEGRRRKCAAGKPQMEVCRRKATIGRCSCLACIIRHL
ncbi:hypothetical protein LK536_23840 [Lachnoclostridium pacaense]|nr:hypothetical protein [Lachnoclostridium pacaense]